MNKLDNGVWCSNPEVYSWFISEGTLNDTRSVTCGDGTIVLGKEEEHRRKCKNIGDWLRNAPVIGELSNTVLEL